MPDVRQYFDEQCLFAYRLEGKELLVKIKSVSAGELVGVGGKKSKKPMVFFEGKALPLGLNKTNMKTIATAYGYDTRAWIGKEIILYPTTTTMQGETVACIRVKLPQARREGPPTQREPGQDND